MRFDVKSHLKALSEAHAPSGHEGAIREIIRDAWSSNTDELSEDGLGSLIGLKRATRRIEPPRKIMLAAHMDEIGMTVAGILDGFIQCRGIGGMDKRLLLAQPVIVHGRERLPGVVASKPPHLLSAASKAKYPAWEDLLIDVGLPAERVVELVQVGDPITLDVEMIELNGQRVAGKAFDDRACLAAVTYCLHELANMHHQWDVYAAATVQEETGLLGAKTASYKIAPDIAIALDVTFAPQPGVDADGTCEMGGGPGIGIGANFHPKLNDKLKETAKQLDMKLQDDILPANSGTDAWAIQVAREGIPSALLEVPIRNMHSPVETADIRDIERCGRLMAHFIAGLEPDFLTTIAWDGANG